MLALPNILTIMRIVLVPVFALAFSDQRQVDDCAYAAASFTAVSVKILHKPLANRMAD